MATVTGLTAERMQEIIDTTVVGATIVSGDLILELYDGSTINAGNVEGPVGPAGDSAVLGTCMWNIQTTVTGWLKFGMTHVGAASAYPDLWAIAPTDWKVGSDLVLPAGPFTAQFGGAVGAITGANTKTLVAANLPPHSHTTPDHTHPMPHVHAGPSHTHPMAHTHEHVHTHTDTFAGATTVTVARRIGASAAPGTTSSVIGASTAGTSDASTTTALASTTISGGVGAASDPTTGASSAANTSAGGTQNTGAASPASTSADGASTTGNGPGTSTAFDVQQRAVQLNFFIKH